jgi:hypothetical protein
MHVTGSDQGHDGAHKKGRERAITLAGDDRGSKPPTPTFNGPPAGPTAPAAWRASTGRHDLSQRQLMLLRDMLQNPDAPGTALNSATAPAPSPEPQVAGVYVNKAWRWGDPMNSTVTLPSEEAAVAPSPLKKQRSSRLGMRGLRDMLKNLRRGVVEQQHQHQQPALPLPPPPPDHIYEHPQAPGRRRAKTSSGPETVASSRLRSPYGTQVSIATNHKSSPRRPSLASIFRIGQRSRSTAAGDSSDNMASTRSASSHNSRTSSSEEEEDWDRMDSASDMDTAAEALQMSGDGTGTVKKRKKPARPSVLPAADSSRTDLPLSSATPISALASASHSSIWEESQSSHQSQAQAHTRPTRLSNVDEREEERRGLTPKKPKSKLKLRSGSGGSEHGPPPAMGHTSSVRSAPPPTMLRMNSSPDGVGLALAMTPENIKPLLDNAKEVQARLQDCIGEVRILLRPGTQ